MKVVFLTSVLHLSIVIFGVQGDDCRFGPDCKYACNCATGGACNSQIGCTGTCGDGWDGPACQRQNVALHQPSEQSSDYCQSGTCYPSGYAVNGQVGHDFFNTPCTHTLQNSPAWWTVTLDQTYIVYRFQIYNRKALPGASRLNGFTLSVGNSSQNYQVCYQDTTTSDQGPGKIISQACNRPLLGDGIKISVANNYLTLCEVQIFVCSAGWYDETCDKECVTEHQCARCDITGIRCEECVPGRWDEHCLTDCGNCWNNNDCAKENGDCPLTGEDPRCEAGYQGALCLSSCTDGNYGPDCVGSCGFCFEGQTVCNITSGHCPTRTDSPRCMAGYEGQKCDTECTEHRWGADCVYQCGKCYNNNVCDRESGDCPVSEDKPRCSAGYLESNCSVACQTGSWGDNCVQNCSINCVNETCVFTDGICIAGCKAGFTGTRCESDLLKDTGPGDTNTGPGGIIGGIVGTLAAVAVTGVVVVVMYRRRYLKATNRKHGQGLAVNGLDEIHGNEEEQRDNPGFCEENGHIPLTGDSYGKLLPISVDAFWDYVKRKSPDEMHNEFEEFPVGLHAKHDVADEPQNKLKSRYKNLVAYDHSRVPLKTLEDEDSSDYMNACYINGYNEPKKYIASQGPNGLNIDDFLRMIWEQNAGKVVMVTNLVEDTKEKCRQYWPNTDSAQFGVINVKTLEEVPCANFTCRTLQLTHAKEKNKKKTVTQFHFTSWPDHGAPSHATGLLQFWAKVLSCKTMLEGPIVVHCSAGIGRTGTFIALDYLITQAKAEGTVDVPACVFRLREQRVNMVQTEIQYKFLHEALAEALKIGDSCLPSAEFPSVYAGLSTAKASTGWIRMEKQFKILSELTESLDDSAVATARLSDNQGKNRSEDILAADFCRPFLSTPVSDGNNYINAVFLPTYTKKRGLILTQTPLPTTVVDFWRLVYDHDVKKIVMLDVPKKQNLNQCVGIYSPETTENYGPFEVKSQNMEKTRDISVWTYQLAYKDKTVPYPITQFRCKFWPGKPTESSIPSLLNVIQMVGNETEAGTVLVHCRDGVTKSGLYCAASSVIERLAVDQDVDILQTVRQMRIKRPEIITDLDQFRFLHQVVIGYLQDSRAYENFNFETVYENV